jgi:hypothetical protein
MERKMNKIMMIVASAVVATAAAWAPAAQAKGGGHGGGMKFSGGMKFGGGMKFSSGPKHHHHHHHRVFRRDIIVAPSYKAEERRAKRVKPVIVPADKGPVVRYADGKGRVYDLGSKVWCDGNKHCWTGKFAWTFRDGTWFYGTSRWHEVDGVWKTAAVEAPSVVDCETVPAFATLKPTTGQQVTRKETGNEGGQAAAPIKTVETSPVSPGAAGAKPTDCKKYFPSVGRMVSVPCEG